MSGSLPLLGWGRAEDIRTQVIARDSTIGGGFNLLAEIDARFPSAPTRCDLPEVGWRSATLMRQTLANSGVRDVRG